MPIPNYGLLTGQLTGHHPQSGGSPHHLLLVSAEGTRVTAAVNLSSSARNFPHELQFQIIDLEGAAAPAVLGLRTAIQTRNHFVLAQRDASIPRLDFVRGGILSMDGFRPLPTGADPEQN